MKALLYARVSDPKIQDTEDKVSIDQQLNDMRNLCERNGWQITGEFVDREYYRATQVPNKGKMVRPSGERADRPQFLKMLKVAKTGDADTILCWRDDRLVRHPRVAVVVEDALDIGDVARNGRAKIELRDATGAILDRFTLAIKAAIWREENKRRAERTKMGKIATLQQGYWPGSYNRYGYKTHPGPRGRIIEIEEDEAQWIRTIHNWFDAGIGACEIRKRLIKSNAPQKGHVALHRWNLSIISSILRDEDYVGVATWNFKDGTSISIDIPSIIDRDLWERNQARIERNKKLSTRNSKGIYLLQGLAVCGHDGAAMVIRRYYYGYVGGVKRPLRSQPFAYFCGVAVKFPDEEHPRPISRYGPTVDWAVWRQIVDSGIKQPDLIRDQVMERQAELRAQSESVDGDIGHIHKKLEEVDRERVFFQRQAARGKITELEFDQRMNETEEARLYWESEIARLLELRDNQEATQASLNYADQLLSQMHTALPEIDISPKELRRLSTEKQRMILKQRQEIVRALVDRVEIHPSGLIKIEGIIDGSEAKQFDLADLTTCQTRV